MKAASYQKASSRVVESSAAFLVGGDRRGGSEGRRPSPELGGVPGYG